MAMTTQCAGPYQVTVTRGWAYPALMPKGTKTAVGVPGICNAEFVTDCGVVWTSF